MTQAAYNPEWSEDMVARDRGDEDAPVYRYAVMFDGTELDRFDTPEDAADHMDYLYYRVPVYAAFREGGQPLTVEEVTEYPGELSDGLPA